MTSAPSPRRSRWPRLRPDGGSSHRCFPPRSAELLAAQISGAQGPWTLPCLSDAVRAALPECLRDGAPVAAETTSNAMVAARETAHFPLARAPRDVPPCPGESAVWLVGRKEFSVAGNKSPSEETESDATEGSVTAEDTGGTEVTAADNQDGAADQPDETSGADDAETETAEAGTSDDDTDSEGSSEDDSDAPSADDADAVVEDAVVSDAEETDADTAPVAATPSTMDHPDQGQSGPGFFPLALGGIVAGVAGFAGGYFFDLNTGDQVADLTGSLETQGAEIATLTEDATALAERAAALEEGLAGLAPPEVDLSGIEGSLEGLTSRLDGLSSILGDLDTRISAIENRPVFTGEGGADEAAVAAAIAQLRSDIRAEQEASADLAASIGAMADDAAARIAQGRGTRRSLGDGRIGTGRAERAAHRHRLGCALCGALGRGCRGAGL